MTLDEVEENRKWEKNCREYSKEDGDIWLEELKQYKSLEDSKRLVKLPCRIGDTVYKISYDRRRIISYKIEEIIISNDIFMVGRDENNTREGLHSSDIGKTVFLEIEDAEKVLGDVKYDKSIK